MIIDDSVIFERKAAKYFCTYYELQLISYIKSTEIEIGLFLNLGEKFELTEKRYE